MFPSSPCRILKFIKHFRSPKSYTNFNNVTTVNTRTLKAFKLQHFFSIDTAVVSHTAHNLNKICSLYIKTILINSIVSINNISATALIYTLLCSQILQNSVYRMINNLSDLRRMFLKYNVLYFSHNCTNVSRIILSGL